MVQTAMKILDALEGDNRKLMTIMHRLTAKSSNIMDKEKLIYSIPKGISKKETWNIIYENIIFNDYFIETLVEKCNDLKVDLNEVYTYLDEAKKSIEDNIDIDEIDIDNRENFNTYTIYLQISNYMKCVNSINKLQFT